MRTIQIGDDLTVSISGDTEGSVSYHYGDRFFKKGGRDDRKVLDLTVIESSEKRKRDDLLKKQ